MAIKLGSVEYYAKQLELSRSTVSRIRKEEGDEGLKKRLKEKLKNENRNPILNELEKDFQNPVLISERELKRIELVQNEGFLPMNIEVSTEDILSNSEIQEVSEIRSLNLQTIKSSCQCVNNYLGGTDIDREAKFKASMGMKYLKLFMTPRKKRRT